MSILRMEDIRGMSEKERRGELESLMKDLLRERGIIGMGGSPENPGRVREIRRTIARIKTIQREEERGKEVAREESRRSK